MSAGKMGMPCAPCCSGGTCAASCHVQGCAGGYVAGATFTVTSGGSTIGVATTDSTGNASVAIPGSGTYTRTITKAGYVAYSVTSAITCPAGNDDVVTLVADANHTCLTCCDSGMLAPTSISLSDGGTSLTLAQVTGACHWAAYRNVSGIPRCDGVTPMILDTAVIVYEVFYTTGTGWRIDISYNLAFGGVIPGVCDYYPHGFVGQHDLYGDTCCTGEIDSVAFGGVCGGPINFTATWPGSFTSSGGGAPYSGPNPPPLGAITITG